VPFVVPVNRSPPVLLCLPLLQQRRRRLPGTRLEDDAGDARLSAAHKPLQDAGRFGPAVRLMADHRRHNPRKHTDPPLVLDGPYAETRSQLLGST